MKTANPSRSNSKVYQLCSNMSRFGGIAYGSDVPYDVAAKRCNFLTFLGFSAEAPDNLGQQDVLMSDISLWFLR